MEENERELIRTRLTKLTKHTRCTPEFLIFFFERKILTFDEIQEIAGCKVDSEKASKFYMLIRTRTDAFAVLKEGLEKYNQTDALNVLEGREDLVSEPTLEEVHSRIASLSFEPTTVSSKKTNISFDVFPPVFSFTGRIAELEQLHKMVLRSQGAKRIAVVTQVTSVSGLGGIGKTQLAREYVRINGKEFDGNVLWMNAESKQSLYNSFKKCAEKKLRLPTKYETGQELSVEDLAEAVYNYFEGWKALFVLDNAEKAPWLKQFMPKGGQGLTLFLLITSRDREWDRGIEVIQLEGLLEDEAVQLIRQGLKIDANDAVLMADARKLAQTLQCFPLALQQAIAYIYEQQRTCHYTIKNYLDEFETKQQLLNYMEEDGICDPIFTTTTATTWSITFDKIKDDANSGWLASLILNALAYLGADDIKRNLFYQIPSVIADAPFSFVNSEQVNTAVRLLVRYSMLSGRENQSILSVHRLVQSVARNQLARDGMEELYLEVILQLLQGSDKNDFPAENIAHALIAWRHAFKSEKIIQGYTWQVYQILWEMNKVGHHNEGIRFGNESLETFKAVLGDDHENVLWIQLNIARILQAEGLFDKGVPIIQNINSKAKSLFGEDSELSMRTKEDLGNALQESGKHNEAQHVLKEVLEKTKVMYGDNHESTLKTENNYGVALMEDGKLSEAEEIFQRILKIYVEKESENSTNVFRLQYNLSVIYSRKGNFEKALGICREVYEKLSSVWFQNVNFFASVICNLGDLLIKIEKFEEALEILERDIEKIKKRLGNKHLTILVIQKRIGRVYRGLENHSRALEILESVHLDFISLFGEDSLRALLANGEVAVTLSCMGQHSEAISKFSEIILKMDTLFRNESWDVLTTKWNFAKAIENSGENFPMALDLLLTVKLSIQPFVGNKLSPGKEALLTNAFLRILNKIGDFDNAMAILQDILPKAKLLLGEDSEFYLETKEELGIALARNKTFNAAKRIFQEVLATKEQLFGKDHLSTLRCKMNYGEALMKNGNLEEADEIFQLIGEICSEKDVENDTNVCKLQNNLANIYSKKGHYGRSLEIYRVVYEKLCPVWNEDAQIFATVCSNFGRTLNAVAKHEEALEILEGNIEKIKELLGHQHKITLLIQQEIGYTYQCSGNFKKAHEILQSVQQGFVSLSGEGSLNALETLYNVAMSLFEIGEHATAFSKFRQVLPGLETFLGKEDLGVIIKKRDFALAITRSGENLQTALNFLKSARTSLSSIIGENSEYVKSISNHTEAIKKKMKSFNEVTSTLQDLLAKAQSEHGEDAEHFLEIKESLGNTLIRNGKYEEAQNHLGEVIKKREGTLGEDHSLTLATKLSYGMALMEDGKLEEAQDIFLKISEFYLERGDENNKYLLRSQICLDLISIRKEVFDKNL